MSPVLKIAICSVAIILAIVVLLIVRKGKITIKYSIFWFLSCILLLITGIMPSILESIAKLLGFQVVSNLVIGIFIFILIIINISLTIIVSTQSNKINLLIQEVSILKQKNNNKEMK